MRAHGLLGSLHVTLVTALALFTTLHAETCPTGSPVGLSDPKIVSLSRIVTSSDMKGHGKDQIRLDCCEGTYGNAWCPDPADKTPYVEIHLEKPVAIGRILIQPPSVKNQDTDFPDNFMKSFDLFFKLSGLRGLATYAKDITAIANKTISLNTMWLQQAIVTDVIRIEPRQSENLPCFRMELYTCDVTSQCPQDYCENGGKCTGPKTCDCSASYFGNKCQFSKQTIPQVMYSFLRIIGNMILTTLNALTFHGDVTLDSSNSLIIKPGSYVQLSSSTASSCYTDLDNCLTGFTLNIVFSFSKLDANRKVVLTNGAGIDSGVKGITLLFDKGELHCYVVTSTKLWKVVKSFTLVELLWYQMSISWSPSQGLLVLQGNSLIGSSFMAEILLTPATTTNNFTIGYNMLTSAADLHWKSMTIIQLFWQDVKRADLLTGCSSGSPVGISDPAVIATNKIFTSSDMIDHGKDKIRLNCCEGTSGNAWCPHPADTTPYVEIHLEKRMAISRILIQPPTVNNQDTDFPDNFMKSFDLLFKLSGIQEKVTYGKDINAIVNKTISLNTIWLQPTIVTDVIRIEPRESERLPCFRMELYTCEVTSVCPKDYCQNNGTCSGPDTCDCPAPYFGDRCQYSKQIIPKVEYTFLQIVQNTITTAHDILTFIGNVTLDISNSLILQPGSYIDLNSLSSSSCYASLDTCFSGFTLNLVFSFTKLDTNRTVVLTNGAETDTGIQGITLLFNKGELHCYVVTSTKLWKVVKSFTLVELSWYEISISWSPSHGLLVLQGGSLVGSSYKAETLTTLATTTHNYIIGYNQITSTSVLHWKSMTIIQLFWQDVERADLLPVICPQRYCLNGGVCYGLNKCNCSATYFGEKCQYTKETIPKAVYTFFEIIGNIIFTSIDTLTFHGEVTLDISNSLTVKPGSYIELNTLSSLSCYKDLDSCLSGFTLNFVFSFTKLDANKKVVLTNGAEIDSGIKGITLLFDKGELHCYVVTSTKLWKVVKSFTLVDLIWYDISISWSPSHGLLVLQGNTLIGSSYTAEILTSVTTTTNMFTIGHNQTTTTTAELHWYSMTIIQVYWDELIKADLVTASTTSLPTTLTASPTTPVMTSPTTPVVTSPTTPVIISPTTPGAVTTAQITTCPSVTAVGVSDLNLIPDSSIIVSSELSDHGKDKIRFDCCKGTNGNAWCPDITDKTPFVEIHLGKQLVIGQIAIQAPTINEQNPVLPENFMKSFDLLVKLPGIKEMVTLAQNVSAIINKTTTLTTISLAPAIVTDFIRIEPRLSEKLPCFRMELYSCKAESLCPQDYCQNGGICIGPNKCNCSATFFGEKCQYTKQTIPNAVVSFIQIIENVIITTIDTLKFHGEVTLDTNNSLTVKPGSYIELNTLSSLSCYKDLDSCLSGFTLNFVFSFTKLDANRKVVLTNGAEIDSGIKGITLLFEKGELHCYVVTSTKLWKVVKSFTLVELIWYQISISWSPSHGLLVLQDNELIGSSYTAEILTSVATTTNMFTIGHNQTTITTAELHWYSMTIIQLFWDEVIRADLLTATTTSVPTTMRASQTSPVKTSGMSPSAETMAQALTCPSVTAVGVSDPNLIPDSSIVVSSELKDHGKDKIRLDCCKGTNGNAWCPDTTDKNPFAEIHLGKQLQIGQIVIQAPTMNEQNPVLPENFMQTFDLLAKLPNQTEMTLLAENISAIINKTTSLATISLGGGVVTDVIRIKPRLSEKLPCFRMELYRCNPASTTTSLPTTVTTLPTTPSTTQEAVTTAKITTIITTKIPEKTPTTAAKIVGHFWNLINITQTILVSFDWQLILIGKPTGGTTGIELNGHDQYMEIPNLNNTCLTNPALCTQGLTINIRIKFVTLEENTIVFTSDGGTTDRPGVILLYRYGFLHAIVRISEQSWYVSVSRKIIWTKDFCDIILTWSQTTNLTLIVNKVVIGESEGPVNHTTNLIPVSSTLTFGGLNTQCIVSQINIWQARLDILVEHDLITWDPSTPKPTTAATTTSRQEDTTLQNGKCPEGCTPTEICFEKPSSTPTTPKCTSPDCEQPTTPKPTESTTPKCTSPDCEQPTTPKPTASTTPKCTSPDCEQPTTPKPTASTTPKCTSPDCEQPTTPKPTESTTPKCTSPDCEQPTTPKPTASTTPKCTSPDCEQPTTPKPTESTTPKCTSPDCEQPTTPKPTESTTPKCTSPDCEQPTTPKPTASTTPKCMSPDCEQPTTPKPTESTPKCTSPDCEQPTTPKPTASTTPKCTSPDCEQPTTPKPTASTTPKCTSPDCEQPTTPKPTTPEPTTPEPTTPKPTTPKPTTPKPTTPKPTTEEPTTRAPTTRPPCPPSTSTVTLKPEINTNGQGQLTCSVTRPPPERTLIKFTWYIEGVTNTWSKQIEAPDKSATITVTELHTSVLNKKITCTAEIKYLIEGAEWCWPMKSNVVVPSIKCPPVNGTITVVEGRDEQHLQVQITVPPSLLCKAEDNGQCRVEVTTTITTVANELMCSRTETIPQAVLGVTTVGQGSQLSCGVTITSENWQNAIIIPIKATVEGVKDGNRNIKLKVTVRIIGQVTLETAVETCGDINVVVVDRDEVCTCTSINDPHLKTFDDIRYNNFIPGEFVMYRHISMEMEVRAFYRACNLRQPRGATCNCGAAVRSGDDVITFDTCGTRQNQITTSGNSVITVAMFKNGQLTPGTRILREGCGQKYEVYLPTGTKVTITTTVKPFMNINIQASSYDFERTEGLCGSYNKKPADDFDGLRVPDDFSRKWIRTTTMFRGVAVITTRSKQTYCSCLSGRQPVCREGLDIYTCGSGIIATNDITAALVSQAKTPVLTQNNVQVPIRGRRAADTLAQEDTEEEALFDEDSAVLYCKQYLENNTAVEGCKNNLKPDAVEASIKNCAEDLLAMNDAQWATSHVDDLIMECLTDAHTNVAAWENNTNADGPKLPDFVNFNLCTESCSVHGLCIKGVCDCDPGWTGERCQIGSDSLPSVLSAEETCDTLESPCTDIPVDGSDFVQTNNLLCKIKYLTIKDKATESVEVYTVPAKFISMIQVVCPQKVGRQLTSKGRSALVTISNDGVKFSNSSYIHLVHKSTCQTCTLSDDLHNVTCQWKVGSCVIDDECYTRSETFGDNVCYYCNPDVSVDKWTKKSDPNCTHSIGECPTVEASTGSSDDDNTAVIVLGVLCGVLALVVVGVTIAMFKMRSSKNSARNSLLEGEGSSYHNQGVPSLTSDLTGKTHSAQPETFYNPTSSN